MQQNKNIIILLLSILTLNIVYSEVITQSQLDDMLTDCYDSNNHPSGLSYTCDSSCQSEVQQLFQDIKRINTEVQAFQPCDQWFDFVDNNQNYDENDIDKDYFEIYSNCLYQISVVSFEKVFFVYECAYFKTYEMLLAQQNNQNTHILKASDIETCEAGCISKIQCNQSCQDTINNNFDETLPDCVAATNRQTQDYQNGIISDQNDHTDQSAAKQRLCYVANTFDNQNIDLSGVMLDQQILFDTATEQNNQYYDYSVYANLATNEEKIFATFDCYANSCHDYYQLYANVQDSEDEYVYYDNDWAFTELYGDDVFEGYDGNDNIDVFWDENDYQNVDCQGDDCIDDLGNFIGQFLGQSSNPCDNKYCFVELFGCIERCSEKNCPKDTCFDKSIGESTSNFFETECTSFIQLQDQYISDGVMELEKSVPERYYQSYGQCISILTENENNNNSRSEEDKEYILKYYSCLSDCTSEETIQKEENYNSKLIISCAFLLQLLIIII